VRQVKTPGRTPERPQTLFSIAPVVARWGREWKKRQGQRASHRALFGLGSGSQILCLSMCVCGAAVLAFLLKMRSLLLLLL
jgi:hypothetical protein